MDKQPDRGRLLAIMAVQLGDHASKDIAIHENDDPCVLAKAFIEANGFSTEILEILVENIEINKKIAYQEAIQGGQVKKVQQDKQEEKKNVIDKNEYDKTKEGKEQQQTVKKTQNQNGEANSNGMINIYEQPNKIQENISSKGQNLEKNNSSERGRQIQDVNKQGDLRKECKESQVASKPRLTQSQERIKPQEKDQIDCMIMTDIKKRDDTQAEQNNPITQQTNKKKSNVGYLEKVIQRTIRATSQTLSQSTPFKPQITLKTQQIVANNINRLSASPFQRLYNQNLSKSNKKEELNRYNNKENSNTKDNKKLMLKLNHFKNQKVSPLKASQIGERLHLQAKQHENKMTSLKNQYEKMEIEKLEGEYQKLYVAKSHSKSPCQSRSSERRSVSNTTTQNQFFPVQQQKSLGTSLLSQEYEKQTQGEQIHQQVGLGQMLQQQQQFYGHKQKYNNECQKIQEQPYQQQQLQQQVTQNKQIINISQNNVPIRLDHLSPSSFNASSDNMMSQISGNISRTRRSDQKENYSPLYSKSPQGNNYQYGNKNTQNKITSNTNYNNIKQSSEFKQQYDESDKSLIGSIRKLQKERKLIELFKQMDSDNDGWISQLKINIITVPPVVLKVISPILYEMEEFDFFLNQNDFIQAIQELEKTLNPKQISILYQEAEEKPRYSGNSLSEIVNNQLKQFDLNQKQLFN